MKARLIIAAAVMALLTACGGQKTVKYANGDTDTFTVGEKEIQMEFKQGDGTMATVPIKINKAIAAMVEGTADYKKWNKQNGHDVYAYVVRNAKRAAIDVQMTCRHTATFRLKEVGVMVDDKDNLTVIDYAFYAKNSFGVEDENYTYLKVHGYDDYRNL